MSSARKVRLVGGYYNGDVRMVDTNYFLMTVRKPIDVRDWKVDRNNEVIEMEDITYKVHKIRGNYEMFYIAAPAEMSIDDAMEKLIYG